MSEDKNYKESLRVFLVLLFIVLIIIIIFFSKKILFIHKLNNKYGNDYCTYGGAHPGSVLQWTTTSYCEYCNKEMEDVEAHALCDEHAIEFNRCAICGRKLGK